METGAHYGQGFLFARPSYPPPPIQISTASERATCGSVYSVINTRLPLMPVFCVETPCQRPAAPATCVGRRRTRRPAKGSRSRANAESRTGCARTQHAARARRRKSIASHGTVIDAVAIILGIRADVAHRGLRRTCAGYGSCRAASCDR